MTVDLCRERAEQFLAGELRPLERKAFLGHARSCEVCAGIIALDAELRTSPGPGDALTAVEGDSVRASVLRELRRGRTPATAAVRSFSRAASGERRGASMLQMASAAVLVLAAGFGAGRLWSGQADEGEVSLASRIQAAALDTRTIADIENSPYTFSNVAFSPMGAGQVAVGFDVSTHVELTANQSDPLVRQLVVQAVLNPSPVGARLNAIALAEGVQDREVMKALRVAMVSDPSVAVRLKALEALAPYKNDPEIQSALLMVLTSAESVQMRLQAIDYLVEGRVDVQAMRDAIRELDPVNDRAALIKASAYLN